jgi:SHS family lactate transporter-like MFS transporter
MGLNLAARLPRPPSKAERAARPSMNPFALMASLTLMQHLLFTSAMLAWIMDAYDFFSVSLSVARLNTLFRTSTTQLTLAITLTLLFRSLGALIFGLISDRYGRKWPLVVNLVIVAILELGSSYVQVSRLD